MAPKYLLEKNVVELEYVEKKISQKHPNWQRVHASTIWDRINNELYNCQLYGFDNLTKYLQAEQWDSFEKWFYISFPQINL